MLVLSPGEKIHVIVRRKFEGDLRRHFIGEVLAVNETVARVEGYVFVVDNVTNQYLRRPDQRTRLIGLADAGYIINVLPAKTDLANAHYTQNKDGKLVVTDGKTFALDVNEFGVQR